MKNENQSAFASYGDYRVYNRLLYGLSPIVLD